MSGGDTNVIDPAEILFGLDNLQTFSSKYVVRGTQTCLWGLQKSCSSIKRLELTKFNIDNRTLVAMLGSCKVLEEIYLRWDTTAFVPFHTFEYNQVIDVNFSELRQVLLVHTETVRVLDLDTESNGSDYMS